MDILAASTDHKYIAFHSALVTDGHSSETTGGATFLVPYDRDERQLPPDQRPLRTFRAIAPGRI
eukprot:3304019-Pyramimonas_sp.AAC.1